MNMPTVPTSSTGQPSPPTLAAPTLAQQQDALVRALVCGAATPDGFAVDRLQSTAIALLRKRSEELRRAWPRLAHGLGPSWEPEFTRWARHRPKTTSSADGLAFAEELLAAGRLPELARLELAAARLARRPAARFAVRTEHVDGVRVSSIVARRHEYRRATGHSS